MVVNEDYWKDSYHSLRAQHSELQRKYHERTEELKRTNVQLSKVETLLRLKGQLEVREVGADDLSVASAGKSKLERRCGELEKRYQAAQRELEKKTREVAVLKRAARRTAQTPPLSAAATDQPSKVATLVSRFKARVEDAEAELDRVRNENRELRETLRKRRPPMEAGAPPVVERAASSKAQEEAAMALREAKAETHHLKLRYEALERKSRAQAEIQKGSLDQLEDYNVRLRDLRSQLSEAIVAKDDAEARAASCNDLRERVAMLQDTNGRLEAEIEKLCSSPFIAEAYDQAERVARLKELETQARHDKAKIEKLEEAKVRLEHEASRLGVDAERVAAEKNDAERRLSELQRDAPRHASPPTTAVPTTSKVGSELDSLENVLTHVRRKQDLDFDLPYPDLVKPNVEGDDDATTAKLRDQYLSARCELDRLDKMLQVQMSINRDLNTELDRARSRQTAETKELVQKIEDVEALATRRLKRITMLEAQVKQARYHGVGKQSRRAELLKDSGDDRSEALLAEAGMLAADENMAEVWIVEVEYEEGVVVGDTSTFAVVDFYIFESQATPWLPGARPEFDFATTYKIRVDDAFLRYLATEVLTIEVCEAKRADYTVVAKGAIPLAPLLDSRPTIVVDRCQLRAPRTGRLLGYARIEIRLALPVTELYQLFLDSHPRERHQIEQAALANLEAEEEKRPTQASRVDSSSSSGANEIEIVVHSASDLGLRDDGEPPSPYVHYQLLEFHDTFTPVCAATTEPTFEHLATFPFASTSQSLAVLRTERLMFTVLDFSEDDNVLIGTAELSLSSLADGERVVSNLNLVSEASGRRVGGLRVAVTWRHDVVLQQKHHALTVDEIAWVLGEFSRYEDGQVDYITFLRAHDVPVAAQRATTKLRSFVERAMVAGDNLELFDRLDLRMLTEDEFATHMLEKGADVPGDELFAFLRWARKANVDFDTPALVKLLTARPTTLESVARSKISKQLDSDMTASNAAVSRDQNSREPSAQSGSTSFSSLPTAHHLA
ncbi:hypothetical protein CTAYLR_009140 [Chrysophaeum taylorii]|uniref:C2 domain-containing protein n=1 Tax=Chrysophaeum taylorii TaxID=2483200 RepID=A0AAD7UL00_9STRA|nr:hypothetical protein CTAYLR_009140 [Chrysophaeum taylorii]